MENKLKAEFDAKKVLMEWEEDDRRPVAKLWYDVTDLVEENTRDVERVFEHIEKIEVSLEGYLTENRVENLDVTIEEFAAERYEKKIESEELEFYKFGDDITVRNNAGYVRVTLKGGVKIVAENSEWGSVFFE